MCPEDRGTGQAQYGSEQQSPTVESTLHCVVLGLELSLRLFDLRCRSLACLADSGSAARPLNFLSRPAVLPAFV